MARLTGKEQSSNTPSRSQVYWATHRGDGNRLPYMNRSFISFTFDGIPIENFNLIATISNNSLNKQGYAEFADITSTYDNLPGQQYWNTHYKTNKIDFVLATDGIEQRELDDFLHLFQAGNAKELVLAEHPNRAILARVASPPQLDLIPFEKPITLDISGFSYDTSTTVYKGTINLSLVMDEPHWYALTNILGIKVGDAYQNLWHDVVTNEDISIFESKDALKILYEDGIPLGTTISNDMLLGNGAYAQVENHTISRIWSVKEANIVWSGDEPTNGEGARVTANDATEGHYLGMVAGAIIDASGNGIVTLPRLAEGYFYYSGTAPSPTIITFTLTPDIDSKGYIATPANSYAKYNNTNNYSSITIRSEHTQYLRFTTPNIYTSYNKVIELFRTYKKPKQFADLREALIENVRHVKVREWASHVIDKHATDNQDTDVSSGMLSDMQKFLQNSHDEIQSATFQFNSETGKASGWFKYRVVSNEDDVISTAVEEDVGDMLRSNYIILRDRNRPTEDGTVVGWEDSPEKRLNSHAIHHNCNVDLSNVSILYKNMYL